MLTSTQRKPSSRSVDSTGKNVRLPGVMSEKLPTVTCHYELGNQLTTEVNAHDANRSSNRVKSLHESCFTYV